MNLRPLSRADARAIDRACEEAGLAVSVLMENAGRGAADVLGREIPANSRVLVVCGSGNNGGDGAVLARHLDAAGHPTRLVWIVSETARFWDGGQALAQNEILVEASRVTIEFSSSADLAPHIAESDWIVDALFGTGLNRPPVGVALDAIEAMNASGKPILALDLPSGLDADTGLPLGQAVRAAITTTFVAPKIGFASPHAAEFLGRVEVVSIGAPRKILEPYRAG